MFWFNQILTIDSSFLIYEGTRKEILQILGSGDEDLKRRLEVAGKKYRSGKARKLYNSVVDQLIYEGKSQSLIRYEVFAQIYRDRLCLLYKTDRHYVPLIEEMPDSIDPSYKWISTWRDFRSGKTTKAMSYDSYLTTSYITNDELGTLVPSLRNLVSRETIIENTAREFIIELLPFLESIHTNGNDAFICHGGYVPNSLKPMSW